MPRDEVTRFLLSVQKDIKSLKDRVESLECSMDSKKGKPNKLAIDCAHSIGVDLNISLVRIISTLIFISYFSKHLIFRNSLMVGIFYISCSFFEEQPGPVCEGNCAGFPY